MIKNKTYNYYVTLSIIFSLFFGILLRFYNLNYEDLWFDELVGFWVSDPSISFIESFHRNNNSEGTPFLFNLILKLIYKTFGYDPEFGRYFSSTIGVLSIFTTAYLAKIIKNNNSYILVIFLTSLNVFLIKYSQELRVYSLLYFLNSLTLIFFFKNLNESNNKNYLELNFFMFIFFQILTILSHPFALIVFFSIILFLMISYLKSHKIYRSLNVSIILIIIFLIFYFPFYLIFTESYPTWVVHPDLGFYTNYYFSKFFGSRILGLIHLSILIYLIYKFKLIQKFESTTIFLIIIFLSYFLPIVFGYLYEPILAPRYITFVIIPIILIISIFIFEINNKVLKYFFILLLVVSTIGNQFTEANIQQFYKERPHYKSQFSLALKEINNSEYKLFTVNMLFSKIHTAPWNKAIKNYLTIVASKNNLLNNFIRDDTLNEIKENHIWIVCLKGLITSNCDKLNIDKEYEILDTKFFNNIQLDLIRILKN